MQQLIEQGYPLKMSDISTGVRVLREKPETDLVDFFADDSLQPAVKRVATPRNVAQKMYLQSIQENDIVFAIGPAGTGKTFLAVAAAAIGGREHLHVMPRRPQALEHLHQPRRDDVVGEARERGDDVQDAHEPVL